MVAHNGLFAIPGRLRWAPGVPFLLYSGRAAGAEAWVSPGANLPSDRSSEEASNAPTGTTATVTETGGRTTNWRFAVNQVVVVAVMYVIYWWGRGLTEGKYAEAAANARKVIDLEKALGLNREEWLQSLIVDHQMLVNLANWVYIWLHWPFIFTIAVWLVLRHPSIYSRTRNAFLISGAAGLVVFLLFPVAPPRLLGDLDLVDTVTKHSHAYRVLQPPGFTNQYAAMPSLHFGWNVLTGVAMVRASRRPALRVLAVIVPVLMAIAIVLTANHFIIDGVAGIAFAGTGLAVATWLDRRRPPPEWQTKPTKPKDEATDEVPGRVAL